MKKVMSILFMLFLAISLNAEVKCQINNSSIIEKDQLTDCIDDARSIAFFMMDNFGFTEDQGAELILLLIEGC